MELNPDDFDVFCLINGLKNEPDLTVSAWADEFRILASVSSAEPGKWKTSKTPYLREIMDTLSSNSTCEKVIFMKGAQIGGTECGNNWMGFIVCHAPGPMLIVNPTIETAKRNSKMRIDPAIENCPELSNRIRDNRSRDSGNTILLKEFPGGVLVMTGANSAVGLRSMPVRYLFLDEVDGFPNDADNEGDPVDLAIQRTATFNNRKIFMVSTPTLKDASRIEQAFLEGDQRYYYVPCPECGHYQTLVWRGIKFDSKNLTDVFYQCEKCDALWHEWQKDFFLPRGHWIAKNPYSKIASFHLNSLYSPYGWASWKSIAQEFLEAHNAKDNQCLQVWTNTKMAESWEDQGKGSIDPTSLMLRRENFGEFLPAGVACLTAGVDVQDNRLEVEIVGWGRAEESWSIDYFVLYGDPSTPELWGQLDAVLGRKYQHSKDISDLGILGCCVDSGGHYTDFVINYCFARSHSRVFAIKGSGISGKPIWPESASKSWKTKKPVYVIGVNDAKDILMRRLNDPECAGAWHFPMNRENEWFEQLTNEVVKTRISKGRHITEWQPRKAGIRTEALDCRVYAYAALRALVRNWKFNLDYTADQISATGLRLRPKNETKTTQAESLQTFATPNIRRVRSKGIDL